MKKLISIFFLMMIVLSACTVKQNQQNDNPTNVDDNINTGSESASLDALEPTQELKKFNSRYDIIEFLEANQGSSNANYGGMTRSLAAIDMDMVVAESSPMTAGAAKIEDGGISGSGASKYSETNIQVEGVDEADFVKNDEKYIYMLVQDTLVIVDAYPAKDAEVVSETNINGNPSEIFVNGDTLIVFTQDNEDVYMFAEYDYVPRPMWKTKTHAIVYDISDRDDPKVIKDYDINGNYYDSRMIGNHVYLISQDYVNYYNRMIDLPMIAEAGGTRITPDVFYFDNPETNYNFNTIISFDLDDLDKDPEAKTFMMGYGTTLYVSQDNIYIAYQKNQPWRWYYQNTKEKFFDVVVPELPDEIQAKIGAIKDEDISDYEKWDKITVVLEDMYNDMMESEKTDLVNDIEDSLMEYEAKLQQERSKTIIHKIAIDDGNIEYDTKGEVKGYLLNQFSMDEYDNHFRVATTVSGWVRGQSIQYNNVFVLDDDLDVVGELEDIAPDERIYSTRFIGDRLYMVTFKQMDPFFVIDLSDPKDPEILGELKIPGFSDYLHPYDEDHIIGIGKETKENERGGVTTEGVKLALFDVSDVENPKQIDKYEIGTSGSNSEALNDHKAFLFDKEKNILVLPVREVKGDRVYDKKYGYYMWDVWQGAYVFGVDPDSGFDLKGKITHDEDRENENYWYYSSSAVRRSLYMDDVLYTISMKKILMNDLSNIDEEINEVSLPYEEDKYYPYRYY